MREVATQVVASIHEGYRDNAEERLAGERIISPEEVLHNKADMGRVVLEGFRRLLIDASHRMLADRFAAPGTPRLSFEVDTNETAFNANARPGYGPGTLRLRVDMQTRAADLKLPEANAELTKALIGALAVAATNLKEEDLPGRRLVEGSRRLLHEHGNPEIITLMGAMVAAHTLRRDH